MASKNDTTHGPFYVGDNYQLHSYERDEGILILPLACTGTVDVYEAVDVHQPIGIRVVDFKATKQGGGPPQVPTPQDTPSGDKILSSSLNVPMPAIPFNQVSANWMWSVSGRYLYMQGAVRGPDQTVNGQTVHSTFETGIPPMILPNMAQRTNQLSTQPGGNNFADMVELATVPPPDPNFASANYSWVSTIFSSVFFNDDLIG